MSDYVLMQPILSDTDTWLHPNQSASNNAFPNIHYQLRISCDLIFPCTMNKLKQVPWNAMS